MGNKPEDDEEEEHEKTPEELQADIDQLLHELAFERILTSVASKDLLEFCQEHVADDGLLPKKDSKITPFDQKKKGCALC